MEYIKNKNVNIVKTDKFKTNFVSIHFSNVLNKNNVTKRAMIPHMIDAGSKEFPSKRLMNHQLEELYDAHFHTYILKTGRLSTIIFSLSFVNDLFLPENIQEKALAFLKNTIFNTDVKNDAFDETKFVQEKRIVKEKLIQKKDNKISYSISQLKKHMFDGESYVIETDGDIDELDLITSKDVYDEYLAMLENDQVTVIMSGPKFSDVTDFNIPSKNEFSVIDYEQNKKDEIKLISEVMEVSQTNFNMGFRVNTYSKDADFLSMMLLNNVLGVAPNSMLFKTLREDNSLCYFVRTSYIGLKGVIYLNAGIDFENIDKARELIFKELENLKQGNISDELIHRAKKVIINDIREMFDRQGNIHAKIFIDTLLNREFSIDDYIEKVNRLSKEDIVKVSSRLELDTEYVLGKEEYTWK